MEYIWTGLIQQFGGVIITFLGILLTGLGGLIVQKFTLQGMEIANSKEQQLTFILKKAVRSTRQQFKDKKNPTDEERMDYAIITAKKFAKERHLKINPLTLEDRLEAEVYGMNNLPAGQYSSPNGEIPTNPSP
jgi:hypothetical protein